MSPPEDRQGGTHVEVQSQYRPDGAPVDDALGIFELCLLDVADYQHELRHYMTQRICENCLSKKVGDVDENRANSGRYSE